MLHIYRDPKTNLKTMTEETENMEQFTDEDFKCSGILLIYLGCVF